MSAVTSYSYEPEVTPRRRSDDSVLFERTRCLSLVESFVASWRNGHGPTWATLVEDIRRGRPVLTTEVVED